MTCAMRNDEQLIFKFLMFLNPDNGKKLEEMYKFICLIEQLTEHSVLMSKVENSFSTHQT